VGFIFRLSESLSIRAFTCIDCVAFPYSGSLHGSLLYDSVDALEELNGASEAIPMEADFVGILPMLE
jgi:hypothetical protein